MLNTIWKWLYNLSPRVLCKCMAHHKYNSILFILEPNTLHLDSSQRPLAGPKTSVLCLGIKKAEAGISLGITTLPPPSLSLSLSHTHTHTHTHTNLEYWLKTTHLLRVELMCWNLKWKIRAEILGWSKSPNFNSIRDLSLAFLSLSFPFPSPLCHSYLFINIL